MDLKSVMSQLHFERRTLETPDGFRSYVVTPRLGLPILFLHGVLRGVDDWDLSALFGDAPAWQVWGLDFRGHGRSEQSRAGAYRVLDYARDAQGLLEEIGRPAVLVGHSLGAMVASIVAATSPSHAAAVVLEDPPWGTMGRELVGTPLHDYFAELFRIQNDAGAHDFGRAIDELRCYDPTSGEWYPLAQRRQPDDLAGLKRGLLAVDSRVFDPILNGSWLDGVDLGSLVARITVPTLILQADPRCGGMLRDKDAELMRHRIPSSSLFRFHGAPHRLHGARRVEFAGLLHSFLSQYAHEVQR